MTGERRHHLDSADPGMPNLRARAEPRLQEPQAVLATLDSKQVEEWIQALQVHQIELEMKNEALRRAHNELEKTHDQYVDLYNHAPVGYITSDTNGTPIKVNQTLADMIGIPLSELMKKGLAPFCDHRDAFYLHCRKMINEGVTTKSEIRLIRTDGTDLYVSAESRLLGRFQADAIHKISTAIIDVSKQQRLEEQLRQAQKMEAVGTLAGGIAHDFNNILSIIIGNSELAFQDLPPHSEARESISEILTASLRARDVVRQLLTMTRRAKGKKHPVVVGAIIEECTHLLRATIPASVSLDLIVDDSCRPVMADPAQIHQMILNLCTNAYQAIIDARGKIRVVVQKHMLKRPTKHVNTTLPSGEYVRISVSDNGSGIDPEHLEQIFDAYFTTKDVGTGLGLAVVYGNTRNLNGGIQVKSKKGAGTTVEIILPATTDESPLISQQPLKALKGNERILLVDDEMGIVKIQQEHLERLGHTVVGLSNSKEALSLFQSTPGQFDLVITDMAMPGMTGVVLAQKLKQIRSDIPVILYTGYSEQIDTRKAKAMGIDRFLLKPVDQATMARTIREVRDSRTRAG